MFSFGLFASHIPYVIFLMAYMLYFGAGIISHPEKVSECSDQELCPTLEMPVQIGQARACSTTVAFETEKTPGALSAKLAPTLTHIKKSFAPDYTPTTGLENIVVTHTSRPPPQFFC